MKHIELAIIATLREEYSDYDKNSWHYSRQAKMIRRAFEHAEKLNNIIQESEVSNCQLCHGSGEYTTGGSFGGYVQVHKCNCKNQNNK